METEPLENMPQELRPAFAALQEAETRLREAAARAAEGGAYDSLGLIVKWAKTVQALVAEAWGSKREELANASVAQVPRKTTNSKPSLSRDQQYRMNRKRASAVAPTFERDSDFLVKRARSRKTRTEYEHRAPADVIFVVADCLAEWRPTKKLLTADQLLDSYSKRKGSVVSYQVYVALGWLSQIGLVRRHGRSGYSVPAPNTIVEEIRKAWATLASTDSDELARKHA